MSGRNTLIITSLLFNLAECTWAIEAEANGVKSKESNISFILIFKDSSMVFFAISPSNGGTLSCNLDNSSDISGGNRSFLVDITWPSLTNIGPKSSNI